MKTLCAASLTSLLVLAMVSHSSAQAPANQLWENNLVGFSSNAIATDGSGNVYVAGQSVIDFSGLLAKYDASGNQLWTVTNAAASNLELAIDAMGNAYVIGPGSGGIHTTKYDSNGCLQWNAHYGTEGVAQSLVVDAAGNVYVTGSSESGVTTIKYAADGTTLWVAGSQLNSVSKITVDSSGKILIGRSNLRSR